MSGPIRPGRRGALTPAVAAAAAFTAAAALVSVAFVTARGGLQMPVAATSAPPVAVASPGSSRAPAPATQGPPPTVAPSSTEPPTGGASPTPQPSPAATAPPTGPPDPLLTLPGCPDHPGCYRYTVRRGDSYTGLSDRYQVLLWIMDALNPEVTNTRVIVVGQTLYLGRDPTARLELCPDGSCHLYVVRSGDRLSTIAGRYGLTVAGIVAINPGLDPNVIVTGQAIRLPLYQAS